MGRQERKATGISVLNANAILTRATSVGVRAADRLTDALAADKPFHPDHTGEGRCLWPQWVPAFAGMIVEKK
jgi:hypothetical protein